MLSAVLTAPHRIEVQHRAVVHPRPGQARIRISYAGICGTDLAIWRGTYAATLPLVLGHEWVGEVLEVGRLEDRRWIGARVVGEITNHCLAEGTSPPCAMCRSGRVGHCLNRSVTGIANHEGAFQEELVVPVGVLHRLPDSVEDLNAVLVEPLAAAIQTFELTPVGPDDTVVVLGAGRLGVLVASVAALRGCKVIAVTRTGRRRELLEGLGAQHVQADISGRVPPIDPLAAAAAPLVDLVMEATEGRGADVVVEVTGTSHGICTACDLVRPRGTICLKSTPGQPATSVNLTRLVVNELRLQGSRCGPFPQAIEHLAHHGELAGLIEQEFALSAIQDAFPAAASGGKTLIKVS